MKLKSDYLFVIGVILILLPLIPGFYSLIAPLLVVGGLLILIGIIKNVLTRTSKNPEIIVKEDYSTITKTNKIVGFLVGYLGCLLLLFGLFYMFASNDNIGAYIFISPIFWIFSIVILGVIAKVTGYFFKGKMHFINKGIIFAAITLLICVIGLILFLFLGSFIYDSFH